MNMINWHHGDQQPVRVLIVDDQPKNLFALKKSLSSISHIIIDTVETGEEALYLAIDHEYAVIILDVQMPRMDGFTVAEYLKQHEETKQVPIIFITAINKNDENIQKGYSVGCVDYLFKPVDPAILKQKVKNFVNLHRALQNLNKSNHDIEQILNSLSESVISVDHQFNIRYANDSGIKMIQQPGKVQSFSMFDALRFYEHGTQIDITNDLKEALTNNHEASIPAVLDVYNHDHTAYTIEMESQSITSYTHQSVGMVFTIRDITESMKMSERLEKQALHDSLTGLPNRVCYGEHLKREILSAERNNTQLVVIFFDLDGFKKINDTLGHEYGDMILKQIALRLRKMARESDIIARFGGDEFVFLCRDIQSPSDAATLAQYIIDEVNRPINLIGQDLYLGASLGIAMYPNDGNRADLLLKHADAAMYLAKERGKNNYQFYEKSLQTKASVVLMVTNEMRRGIKQGEFEVYFQPQVDSIAQTLIGFEALVRWRHPQKGFIQPSGFIPMAEEHGLIPLLDEYVFQQVCEKIQSFIQLGYPDFRYAINLSPKQFNFPNFSEKLFKIAQDYNLDGQHIELEVTENVLIDAEKEVIKTLHKIKNHGFSLVLDDFGTGYSSLRYLTRLPIDKLKIDQSFVKNISVSQKDMAIIDTIIDMADSLSFNLLAEGVETIEQSNYLKKRGCHFCQGFLYSKAVEAKKMTSLIHAPETLFKKANGM